MAIVHRMLRADEHWNEMENPAQIANEPTWHDAGVIPEAHA